MTRSCSSVTGEYYFISPFDDLFKQRGSRQYQLYSRVIPRGQIESISFQSAFTKLAAIWIVVMLSLKSDYFCHQPMWYIVGDFNGDYRGTLSAKSKFFSVFAGCSTFNKHCSRWEAPLNHHRSPGSQSIRQTASHTEFLVYLGEVYLTRPARLRQSSDEMPTKYMICEALENHRATAWWPMPSTMTRLLVPLRIQPAHNIIISQHVAPHSMNQHWLISRRSAHGSWSWLLKIKRCRTVQSSVYGAVDGCLATGDQLVPTTPHEAFMQQCHHSRRYLMME